MSLPPLPLIDGKLFIDNSGFMEGCSSCYRYLQYKCLNLRIPSAEKPALNFGSAMHLAEELRYVLYGTGPVDQQYWELLTPILTDFFEKHKPASDDWRTLNWCMEMMKKYMERYPMEEFQLLRYKKSVPCPACEGRGCKQESQEEATWGIDKCVWCKGTGKREMMVECTFTLPLYTHIEPGNTIPVIYSGRIDLPLSLNSDIWIMDNKHVGMLGQTFWDEQRMAAQYRGYVWAFEQLTGTRPKGYMVNAVRTKEPPLYITGTGRRGSQSPGQWWQDSMQRERFLCEPWKIEEWKNNTIDLVEEFMWHYGRGYMPQKTKWCSQYGRCPYYDICTITPQDRGVLLQSGQFMDNVWSPLKQPTQSKQ